jgi:CsoR family transcriptional regulator, copper-sensing transcriptional repressor
MGEVPEDSAAAPESAEGESAGDGPHGYSPRKENYAKRLRRIEGQVRGIARMIDEDKYCIDVLTQISAVNSALQSVALGLLDEHLGHCVTHAVAAGGPEADEKLAEASAAIARLVRS